MLFKIGVKFCGNCNPQIDTKAVYLRVKNLIMRQKNDVELCSWDTPGVYNLLVICGCTVNCASRPHDVITEVTIAGETVNALQCKNEDLPIEAVRAIKKIAGLTVGP